VRILNGGRRRDYDPDSVLRTRVAVCEGYAALFTALCNEVGVEANTVNGNLRTKPEEIGTPISNNTLGHAWNSAKVDGRWVLVDCTLGAGGLDRDKFDHHYEPAWFDVPPAQMIWTHLPEDSRWQMLPDAQIVSQTTFERLPLVEPRFFQVFVNAGALYTGILDRSAQPLLHVEVRPEVQVIAKLSDGRDSGQDATIVRLPTQDHALALINITLAQDGSTNGRSFLTLYTHTPGQPSQRFERAAAFKLAGVAAAVPRPAETAVSPRPPAPGAERPILFPTYAERRVQLQAPLAGALRADSWQDFKIVVPGARGVQVLNVGLPSPCHRVGNGWEAHLKVQPGKCTLIASFEEGQGLFYSLVEFDVR
jgi:hypothetical protein